MRCISTRTHGALDYIVGILMIVSPWLFNFATGGAETWVPVLIGASALIYSMMTGYEFGLIRAISMSVHLRLDFIAGAILAGSPWLFGFSPIVWLPHLVIGVYEMLMALSTRLYPDEDHLITLAVYS